MKKIPTKKALAQEVTLHDPHPGFAGACIPFPKFAKEKADELDGKTMLLSEAIAAFEEVFEGVEGVEVTFHQEYQFISVVMSDGDEYPVHHFRAIRYRAKDSALQS